MLAWIRAGSMLAARFEGFLGIEGWFDPPSSYDAVDLRPGPTPPPRWKQAVVVLVAFFCSAWIHRSPTC